MSLQRYVTVVNVSVLPDLSPPFSKLNNLIVCKFSVPIA